MQKTTADHQRTKEKLAEAPLGKTSKYISTYSPRLLFSISRKLKRDEIGVPEQLPFKGFDTWNAYEVSWLNARGKPVVAIVQFDISCSSTHIIESKSFKLYLNSFNHTKFESVANVKTILEKDIQKAADGPVTVNIFRLEDISGQKIENFVGKLLDDLDVKCDTYLVNPNYLLSDSEKVVEESLLSNLLKSNCLVTGQPDWGSVEVSYKGPKIDSAGLLKYIISFRNHNEFHEQCVERIFMDVLNHCKPEKLTVHARYTRRGGLDINPIRSTENIIPAPNIRMARQ